MPLAAKPNRISCCVPFCRRTAPEAHHVLIIEGVHVVCDEIICGIHWRMAPEVIRQVYSRAKKRLKRTESAHHAVIMDRAYRKAKKRILDRAGGLE